MKLTNKTGLPMPVVKMAEKLINSHPSFDDSKFSVTELLKSTRQIVLSRRFSDVIEMDVQDTYNMWSGTSIHEGLEREASLLEEYVPETRFELDLGEGLTLSGGFDLYDKENNILYDYKNTKVATYKSNISGDEDKWIKQLYLYTLGIESLYGKKPEKVVVVAMLKDHSKIKSQVEAGYPQHPIMMIEWNIDDIEKYSSALEDARDKAIEVREYLISGDEPPACSYSDCWCTEDWAIKKPEAKRADRKFDSPEEAFNAYIDLSIADREKKRIFHRVSDFKNCRDYCTCSAFCAQWKANEGHEAFEEDVTIDLEFEYAPF